MDHLRSIIHRPPAAAVMLLPGNAQPATRWMRGRLDEVLAWLPRLETQAVDSRPRDYVGHALKSPGLRVTESYGASGPDYRVGGAHIPLRQTCHRELGAALRKALSDVGIPPDGLDTHVTLDRFGARSCLQINLPASLMMHPRDGNPMVLQCRAYNTMDGSAALRIALVWYRLICTNGLIVGTSTLGDSMAHREAMDLAGIDRFLSGGMALARIDSNAFRVWETTLAPESGWSLFADGPLKNTWGAMNAARWLSIMRSGRDARPWDAFEKAQPSLRKMVLEQPVPGSPQRGTSLWHAAQALSWVTRTRADLVDQLDRLRDIPWLIEQLDAAAHSKPVHTPRSLH